MHPGLTDYGRYQIDQLKELVSIQAGDIVLVSPTRRTIETAEQLFPGRSYYVSPYVGPRMFPQNPELEALLCDVVYSRDEVLKQKRTHCIVDFMDTEWEADGINRIADKVFEEYAAQLLNWCKERARRVFVISHDGTITNYRIYLGEKGLTRKDFLGEAGMYTLTM